VSPVWGGPSCSHPGSAPRFSQPLSGFLANPSSTALFRAATVPGLPPSEPSPHRDRAPLSRPPASLQSSSSVPAGRAAGGSSPPVSPTPTPSPAQLPGSPEGPGLLSASRSPLPGRPAPPTAEPPRSAAFICFEAFLPLRVRSPGTGSPRRRGRCSPGFLPSEVPSRTSEPRPARTEARTRAFSRRIQPATPRTSSPPGQVSPPRCPKTPGRPRRQSPTSFEVGPRRLSTATPSLPALNHRSPDGPDPQSFEVPGR
jgi:hypothetical protein